MKLDSKTSVFNMGDTSIRVKQVVEVNKIILQQLNEFMQSDTIWNSNKDEQENFYRNFIKEIVRIETEDNIELFSDFKRLKNYQQPSDSKKGLRGRTLTNALVKSGLINSQRQLSEVGQNYLEESLKTSDAVEELLAFSEDNLVYFRQYLKLRIYSADSNSYFYNFRFALKFLARHNNVPQNDFLTIIESIRPEQSESELNNLIENYSKVTEEEMLFDDFYKENFAYALRSKEEIDEVKKMFKEENFSDENFILYFPNAKSSHTSLLYKEFVLALINFKKDPSNENLKQLIKLSRDSKIKKAFSSGKLPFKIERNATPESFSFTNAESKLLSDDNFDIYLEFVFSKHNDLIREYSDMCRRAFQITGAISFENGLVNLNNKWILNPLIEILGNQFSLSGEDSYENYEENLNSPWFKDFSTMEILNITTEQYDSLIQNIALEFNETEISKIPELIIEKREQEYRKYIYEHFPKEKVMKILHNISVRNDYNVFEEVTDNATIPTIFEYMLTITWFYISKDKGFYLHKSFGVSLDGNKLPLSHKAGGAGDIEIHGRDYSLLIEGTLMDRNTQRRGELEPVIRHSINFSLDCVPNKTNTIFIANELDNNVLNIFRATQFITLNGTLDSSEEVQGLNIFSFTTHEIINILNHDIDDIKILDTINNNLDPEPIIIGNNWRNSIVEQILSTP